MGKRIISILFLLLMFLPFVSCAPPFSNQQFTEGYILKLPSNTVLKIGQPFEMSVHIYNISNGMPINSGVTCYFHLYNSSGEHVLEMTDTTASSSFDYSFLIGKGNITKNIATYVVQCNSSKLGGYMVSEISANSIGYTLDSQTAMLYLGLLALLVLIFVLNFVGMKLLPDKNQRDEEGKLLSISYLKYFRNVLWMSGYFIFVGIVYIASNLAFAFFHEELVARVLFMIFHISLACSPIVVIIWIIWIFVSMFHDKQLQNLLNRGMFKEGNL